MATLKTWNTLTAAQIKTYGPTAKAALKTINGLSLAAGDPYFANVVLLAFNDNGADGTTTFTDQSGSAHTLTAVGNVQWDTAQAPTGMTSSCLLDGTGDWIRSADSADWNFGSGDFTLQTWVRFNSATATAVFISQMDGGGGAGSAFSLLYNKAAGDLRFFAYTSSLQLINRAWVPVADTWYAVEVDRVGTSLYLFINGTQLGTTGTLSGTIADSAYDLSLGSHSDNAFPLNGWMGPTRITKGVGRNSGNFTPPTLPLPTS